MFYIFRLLLISFLPLLSLSLSASSPAEIESARNIINAKDPTPKFVDEQGNLSDNVIKLLKINNMYVEGDTLETVYEKVVAHWISAGAEIGKEHTDIVDSPERQQVRAEIVKIAQEMGLFEERAPSLKQYDYAICLGAFLDGVRARLSRLVDLWNSGIRFDSIVFLTGERYLRKGPGGKDDYADYLNPARSSLHFKPDWKPLPINQVQYETEYDMCKLVWEQVELPSDMAAALKDKAVFVNAPKGDKTRPNTKDTYNEWMTAYHPTPGTIIASSDPLLYNYQQLGGMLIIDNRFVLDTVAPRAPYLIQRIYEPGLGSIVLDVVAKCLLEIHKIRTEKQ